MIIGTWNVNHRVGKVRFRPEAAHAATAIGANLLVITEFYPQKFEEEFRAVIAEAGWQHQLLSPVAPELANRILIVSRQPIEHLSLPAPLFDHQFPSNLLAVTVPSERLSIVGIRVPAYFGATAALLRSAWTWIESTAKSLSSRASLILGDLNVSTSSRTTGGSYFRKILNSGWVRANTEDRFTFFGHGGKSSETDHILATKHCLLRNARVVKRAGDFDLADSDSALSDHAAVICDVVVREQA